MTLKEAFDHQAISCIRLGSPFMGKLLSMLAIYWPAETPLGKRVSEFAGDIGPAGASLPLRIAGGLHALVLSQRAPHLAQVYPPNDFTEPELCTAVLAALNEHEGFLLDWIESPPQTNEVRRSAALMAGAAVVRKHFDLPVRLSELGASGGLNMMWDRYELQLPQARLGSSAPALVLRPEWEGPMPPCKLPEVVERAGVDLNPLDPNKPNDLLRLTSFLWPDQPERLALTRAAAAVATGPVLTGDAIDWLEKRLSQAQSGQTHIIQHTVAWQYFPKHAQARGRALIENAGQSATVNRPLAWLALESDGDTKGAHGAALTLRLWPGDLHLPLGRADFHGRWIKWAGTF